MPTRVTSRAVTRLATTKGTTVTPNQTPNRATGTPSVSIMMNDEPEIQANTPP
jgi:hypothetical protein